MLHFALLRFALLSFGCYVSLFFVCVENTSTFTPASTQGGQRRGRQLQEIRHLPARGRCDGVCRAHVQRKDPAPCGPSGPDLLLFVVVFRDHFRGFVCFSSYSRVCRVLEVACVSLCVVCWCWYEQLGIVGEGRGSRFFVFFGFFLDILLDVNFVVTLVSLTLFVLLFNRKTKKRPSPNPKATTNILCFSLICSSIFYFILFFCCGRHRLSARSESETACRWRHVCRGAVTCTPTPSCHSLMALGEKKPKIRKNVGRKTKERG